MPEPLISVIIPTYNRSSMLCGAVDCILAQTYSPLEIIVVDDGSTDETRALIQSRYGSDSRVRYCYRENGGPAAARNTGLQMAKGEWIAFQDSDDFSSPDRLKRQMAMLHKHPKASLCVTNLVFRGGEHDGQDFFEQAGFNRRMEVASLFPVITMPGATAVVKRSAMESVGGFDDRLHAVVDWDLFVRLLYRHSGVFVDEVLYDYQIHSQEQIVGDSLKLWRYLLISATKNRGIFEHGGIDESQFGLIFYNFVMVHAFQAVLQLPVSEGKPLAGPALVSEDSPATRWLYRALAGRPRHALKGDVRPGFEDALRTFLGAMSQNDYPNLPERALEEMVHALSRRGKSRAYQKQYRRTCEEFYRELMWRNRFSEARIYLGALWLNQPWRVKILLRWLFSWLGIRLWLLPSPHKGFL